MQQFAFASIYPRSITWFIRLDEWERFVKIVNYNCAMVGGYFNVFIPLTDEDTITEAYQRFLIDYDPDLIVLAPGIQPEQLDYLTSRIFPFGIVPWESVSQFVSLDPLSLGGGQNVTTMAEEEKLFNGQHRFVNAYVAVADEQYPDTSRLALVACGDVVPREPMFNMMDEDVHLDATGYRERFLEKLASDAYDRKYVGAFLKDEQHLVPAPNLYQLKNIISEQYQFPLSDAAKILEVCCRLQHFVSVHRSFIDLTIGYCNTGGTPQRVNSPMENHTPAIVIMVSEQFGLEESLLFWNLRANAIYVAWLSFSMLEKYKEEVVRWLESDYGGLFYSMARGLSITFASMSDELARLQLIVDDMQKKKSKPYLSWQVLSREALIFYNYVRPAIVQERVMVVNEGRGFTFAPKLPSKKFLGIYTLTLQWNECMLPKNKQVVQDGVSFQWLRGFMPFFQDGQRVTEQGMAIPRFRINNEHYLKIQLDSEQPINFNKPPVGQVVETIFRDGGFARLERSDAAQYQMMFIRRAGDLDKAVHYLAKSPYRELFALLSDNSKENKVGWLLKEPSQRRALHHLYVYDALGKTILSDTKTKEYFGTISDQLPEEIVELLSCHLLERGFELKCHACSFKSWYPAERVGQTFECSRCFQTQVCTSNPLWLYKLPEVIFQGFNDNMQVPLLALSYLKRKSLHVFEWLPDSNLYVNADGKGPLGNIDILCLCDGKFYIGEAKSNNEIKKDQFAFYEGICRSVAVDGVVLATTEPYWNRGTLQRIEQLKSWFTGEVLVLTEKDLYFD
jgi:hypothetical protein